MWTCTRLTAGIARLPSRETLEALHDVVKAGKARLYRGVVNVRLAVLQGALPGRPAWMDTVRLDAEPL